MESLIPPPPSLEEMSTRAAARLLLPWILSFLRRSNANFNSSVPREVGVFVHQPTRSITLIEGDADIQSLLGEAGHSGKGGIMPASKASIDSLPVIRVTESGLECPICLVEFQVNGEETVKEMPCGHRFHAACIDKWLGIHGTCPMCRVAVEKGSYGLPPPPQNGWRIHVFFASGRVGAGSDPGMEMERDPGTDEDEEEEEDSDNDDEEMDNIN